MHNTLTISRSRAVETAMDIQCIALRRIVVDRDESKDYHELAVLATNLETIAHRCIRRDEEENHDHAEMRVLARRICELLEGLENNGDAS